VLAPSSVAATWDLVAGGLGRDVSLIDAALEEAFGRTAVSRTALGGLLRRGVVRAVPGSGERRPVRGGPRVLTRVRGAAPSRGAAPDLGDARNGDRVLPVDRCGRRVVRRLTADGYAVTYEEVDGGHAIPPDRITAGLDHWLGSG
jgi:hypothetical protein